MQLINHFYYSMVGIGQWSSSLYAIKHYMQLSNMQLSDTVCSLNKVIHFSYPAYPNRIGIARVYCSLDAFVISFSCPEYSSGCLGHVSTLHLMLFGLAVGQFWKFISKQVLKAFSSLCNTIFHVNHK
jgi:hypothetical protein